MKKKSEKKQETTIPKTFKIEVVKTEKNKKIRLTEYEGNSAVDAVKTLTNLRSQDTPHIEVTDHNKKLIHIYEKKGRNKNYRLTGKKI